MKFLETHFEEYIKSNVNNPLHLKEYEIASDNITDLNNLIIYLFLN